MTPLPRVSIIIPCYNHGHYLQEAIDSVEQYQPQEDYELLIINDGSTDKNTIGILQKLENEGYQIIHQENKGLAGARNQGIKESSGDYILPLDSDNRIRPTYISKGIQILDKYKDVGVVYGNRQLFGEENQIFIPPEFSIRWQLVQNHIDACAMIRKNVLKKLDGYDADMPVMGYEDWELWIRIYKAGYKFYHINKVLFDYRVDESSMVHNTKKEEKHKRVIYYIHQKHLDLLSSEYRRLRLEQFEMSVSLVKPLFQWLKNIRSRIINYGKQTY